MFSITNFETYVQIMKFHNNNQRPFIDYGCNKFTTCYNCNGVNDMVQPLHLVCSRITKCYFLVFIYLYPSLKYTFYYLVNGDTKSKNDCSNYIHLYSKYDNVSVKFGYSLCNRVHLCFRRKRQKPSHMHKIILHILKKILQHHFM